MKNTVKLAFTLLTVVSFSQNTATINSISVLNRNYFEIKCDAFINAKTPHQNELLNKNYNFEVTNITNNDFVNCIIKFTGSEDNTENTRLIYITNTDESIYFKINKKLFSEICYSIPDNNPLKVDIPNVEV